MALWFFLFWDVKNWRQQWLYHQEVPKAEGYSGGGYGRGLMYLYPLGSKKASLLILSPLIIMKLWNFPFLPPCLFLSFLSLSGTLGIRILASKVDGKSFEFLPLGISGFEWKWTPQFHNQRNYICRCYVLKMKQAPLYKKPMFQLKTRWEESRVCDGCSGLHWHFFEGNCGSGQEICFFPSVYCLLLLRILITLVMFSSIRAIIMSFNFKSAI